MPKGVGTLRRDCAARIDSQHGRIVGRNVRPERARIIEREVWCERAWIVERKIWSERVWIVNLRVRPERAWIIEPEVWCERAWIGEWKVWSECVRVAELDVRIVAVVRRSDGNWPAGVDMRLRRRGRHDNRGRRVLYRGSAKHGSRHHGRSSTLVDDRPVWLRRNTTLLGIRLVWLRLSIGGIWNSGNGRQYG